MAASIAAALTAVELGRAGLDLLPDLAALATHGNPVVISDRIRARVRVEPEPEPEAVALARA